MRSTNATLALAILVSLSAPPETTADSLILSDGDRLSGELLSVSPLRARFRYRGAVLPIKRNEIERLEAPGNFLITFASGEVLRGPITGGRSSGLLVGRNRDGRKLLTAQRLSDTDTQEVTNKDSAGAAEEAPADPEVVPADQSLDELEDNLFGEAAAVQHQWTGKAAFAFGAIRGNAHQTSGRARLEARRRVDRKRTRLVLESERVSSDREVFRNRRLGQLRFVRVGGPRLLGGVTFQVATDDLRQLDLRRQVAVDLGRAWRGTRENWVEYRLSLAYAHDRFDGAPSQNELGIQASLAMRKFLTQDLRWEQRLEVFPDLRSGDVRALSSTKFTIPAGKNIDWTTDLRLRFDSGALPGVEDLDATFLTGIERSF